MVLPAQCKVVSIQVLHTSLLRACNLSRRHFPGQRPDYALDDFILDLEYLFEIAIVSLGPGMCACRSLDKLSCDTHPSAHLANAALHHVAHPQHAPDLRD